ncbi:MAG TPA: DUF3891 family protein [Vicinamibacterales bacterium]|nr:DUF3891 family protein [Vicinamibacterales bacterium]
MSSGEFSQTVEQDNGSDYAASILCFVTILAAADETMIIRRDQDTLLFITQPDHARLAAEAIAAWCADGFQANPRRELILLAVREHDNGWLEEDAATHVGPDGTPLDFVNVPAHVRHRIWPRAVDRVAVEHPYAAALVAQHALTIYVQMQADRAWDPFFTTMAARRASMLDRCGNDAARTIDADYAFLNAADRMSLAFCTGWGQALESGGRQIILAGRTVRVSPDPFCGARVPLQVTARRAPDRRFASNAELRAALDAAPIELLAGDAAG